VYVDRIHLHTVLPQKGARTVAQKVLVRVTSDLSGKPDAETIRFAYEGYDYEIDLTVAEQEKLGAFLSVYLASGRRIGRTGSGQPRNARGRVPRRTADSNTIRDWARENGFEVSSRGRIPASVQDAYDNRSK
jgi:hypothetical protein